LKTPVTSPRSSNRSERPECRPINSDAALDAAPCGVGRSSINVGSPSRSEPRTHTHLYRPR
jgi:hypothetical protein